MKTETLLKLKPKIALPKADLVGLKKSKQITEKVKNVAGGVNVVIKKIKGED